jgi:predicted O-linked N-acetylglucosamine transferase (SPINDLY family)
MPPIELKYWQEQANQYLLLGNYSQAVSVWEEALEAEPFVKSHYWNLGLMLLLQGQEETAQTAWLLGMVEGDPDQVEEWTRELIQVLQTEAERQENIPDYSVALAIRQHLRQISPSEINNLLKLVWLNIQLGKLNEEDLNDLDIINLLQSKPSQVSTTLLMEVLQSMLDFAPTHPLCLEFTKACLNYITNPKIFIAMVIPIAVRTAYSAAQPSIAAEWMELCLTIDEKNLEVLKHLATFYQNSCNYAKGIETAKLGYDLAPTLPEKIISNHLVLRGLLNAGSNWQEACSVLHQHQNLLQELIAAPPKNIDQAILMRLVNTPYFQPYFQDKPKENRSIQNQLVKIFQQHTRQNFHESWERYQQPRSLSTKPRPIKIGYLSYSLYRHSVGWLARWLFKHQDRDRFQINTYFINYRQKEDFLQQWYVSYSNSVHKGDIYGGDIADRIYEDQVDILIDLDSLTLDVNCQILALKPAPVQVSWLGWDAPGIPAIDYFIADPYVLPEEAQEYYPETIWRLPQTYIAVDGFEVGVPTLRRDSLDIPSEAVVYLSAQRGHKRHPDTARLQMKIIKEVPNSYFLIKGLADEKAVQEFFKQLAEEEGVAIDRLRFLGLEFLEETHRANLGIADIVLDTYPYNGATTTLETLWMGIPLVTRVGQQFAARNSYTMMVNAGISEGIAWTDEEYVEWGVRLGKDAVLREQIHWRLLQSRKTAPLWNAKQFARDMENAYEQMWSRYVEENQ